MMDSGKRLFDVYIGIDYSGAKTPTSSLKGLRVYRAEWDALPIEIQPPPSPRKYWTRRGIAEWLVEQLRQDRRTVVGIDHGFSFPVQYFDNHELPHDWPTFLEDFHQHWPIDGDKKWVEECRTSTGAERMGSARWRRLTEVRAGSAKSVFHFDVQGAVAKSTHSGIPWLAYIRRHIGERVHLWPFDGWDIPGGRSVIAEVYPALWSGDFPREERTGDQHDAYSVAAKMRQLDLEGNLSLHFSPVLTDDERSKAQFEGWILGVGYLPRGVG